MTKEEASKIAAIVSLVDGGCGVCVRSATTKLMRDFPEIDWKEAIRPFAQEHYWRDEFESWIAADDDY